MSRAVSSNLYSSIASRTTSLWPLPAAMWSIVWPWLVTEWSRESILGDRYRMMSTWPPSAALCKAFCPLYKNRKNNQWTHDWKCTLTVYTKNDKSKQTVPFVCSEVTRQPGHSGYTNGSQSDGVCGGSGTECYVLWRHVCSMVNLCKCKLHLVCSAHWAALPNEVSHFVKVSFLSCS